MIVTSAQAEGIPALYSVMPHFPLFRGDVFQRVIVIFDPYVGPVQACNRSFQRPPIHMGVCD
jgi:hypothetical protein